MAGQKHVGQAMIPYLANLLQAKGFKGNARIAAAGIVGNLAEESGHFSQDVIRAERKGDGGKAHGIAQWHPDRWQPLLKWAKSQGINPLTWQTQAAYIVQEMQTTERRAWNKLEGAKTVEDAALAFLAFERPAGYQNGPTGVPSHKKRMNHARSYAGMPALSSEEVAAAGVNTTGDGGEDYNNSASDPVTAGLTAGQQFLRDYDPLANLGLAPPTSSDSIDGADSSDSIGNSYLDRYKEVDDNFKALLNPLGIQTPQLTNFITGNK